MIIQVYCCCCTLYLKYVFNNFDTFIQKLNSIKAKKKERKKERRLIVISISSFFYSKIIKLTIYFHYHKPFFAIFKMIYCIIMITKATEYFITFNFVKILN
jgi:hypothetical protein